MDELDLDQLDHLDLTLSGGESILFDISVNGTIEHQALFDNKHIEDTLIQHSLNNLSSILISLLRKRFTNDEKILQFINLLSSFMFSKQNSYLFYKYSSSMIDLNFNHFKTTFNIDPLLFYRYNSNLYLFLIGDDNVPFDQMNYEFRIKYLFQRYSKQLRLKLNIAKDRNYLCSQFDKLFKLFADCHDRHFQAQIKLIFLESFAEIEFLKEKYIAEKRLIEKEQPETNLFDDFTQIVIENEKLLKHIAYLKNQHKRLLQLNQEKVEQFRNLLKELQFVENLNRTPNQNSSCEDSYSRLSISLDRIIF